jgi:hypothetical protein
MSKDPTQTPTARRILGILAPLDALTKEEITQESGAHPDTIKRTLRALVRSEKVISFRMETSRCTFYTVPQTPEQKEERRAAAVKMRLENEAWQKLARIEVALERMLAPEGQAH